MDGKLTQAIKQVVQLNRIQEEKKHLSDADKEIQQIRLLQQKRKDMEDKKDEIVYLSKFIQITEQCLNNPNKSANNSTDLIILISQLIIEPKLWAKNFDSDNQYIKYQIQDQINQFLQNSILIIENQKPVQKIMIMALTNLVNVTEPKQESLSELCMRTLRDLYCNNVEIRKTLQKAIKQTVLGMLDQDDFQLIPIQVMKGLIDFAKEVDIGDWLSEKLRLNFVNWLKQIFTKFDNIEQETQEEVQNPVGQQQQVQLIRKQSNIIEQGKQDKSSVKQDEKQVQKVDKIKTLPVKLLPQIDACLELISKCAHDKQFANTLQTQINLKGVLNILNQCSDIQLAPDENARKRAAKPDDKKEQKPDAIKMKLQKMKQIPEEAQNRNRLIVFVLEMVYKAKKIKDLGKEDQILELRKFIENMIDLTYQDFIGSELKYSFTLSPEVKTPEQCQIQNRKFGILFLVYGQIINTQKEGLENNKVIQNCCSLLVHKKIDPYIYGSLCLFFANIIQGQFSLTNDKSNLVVQEMLKSSEQLTHVLQMLTPSYYNELIMFSKLYGPTGIPAEFSFSYMPTRELQYCIQSILELFTTIKEYSENNKNPNLKQILVATQDGLEIQNYKNIILQCLQAPNEQIRVKVSNLLQKIQFNKWDIEDAKIMLKVLQQLWKLLPDGLGENELSTLLLIFCQVISEKTNEITKLILTGQNRQFFVNIVKVCHQILCTNMMRNTSGDEDQTNEKIGLSVSCVFLQLYLIYQLLQQFTGYNQMRPQLTHYEATNSLYKALIYEDMYLKDTQWPICTEQVCLIMQPIFQSFEADISPINPFHLQFFRNLIQIGRILDTTSYAKIMLPEEKKLKLEDSIAIKLDFQQEFFKNAVSMWGKWKIIKKRLEEVKRKVEQILKNQKFALQNQTLKDQLKKTDNKEKKDKNKDKKQQEDDEGKGNVEFDDLISSFEVQHTIFSSQNGVDRLLICLKKLTDKAIIKLDVKEIHEDSLLQFEDQVEQNSTFLKHSFSKHALHTQLVGQKIGEKINVAQYQSHFFETIQKKKTIANSMIDLAEIKDINEFYQFMSDPTSQKTKIALITSAFFYCCYSSIINAPNTELQNNALAEIQQKYKLIGYIKLCAISEWYNGMVSQKLFKIQRLIFKQIMLYNNIERIETHPLEVLQKKFKKLQESQQKGQEFDKQRFEMDKEIKELTEQVKKNIQEFYKTPLSLQEQIENVSLLFQVIQTIMSDFKEIIECLNKKQLEGQLKLVNGIFKTIILIFKQFQIFASQKLTTDQSLKEKIYKFMVNCANKTISLSFFHEIVTCVQKLDKKLNQVEDQTYLLKIILTLSQVLGFYYPLTGTELKKLFSIICKKFESDRLANVVNRSINEWIVQMVLIKIFSLHHPNCSELFRQVHLQNFEVDFTVEAAIPQPKRCILVFYTNCWVVLELINIEISFEFLQDRITSENIKIHLIERGEILRDVQIKEDKVKTIDDEENSTLIVVTMDTSKGADEQVYYFTFVNSYLSKKALKIFGQYLDYIGDRNGIIL